MAHSESGKWPDNRQWGGNRGSFGGSAGRGYDRPNRSTYRPPHLRQSGRGRNGRSSHHSQNEPHSQNSTSQPNSTFYNPGQGQQQPRGHHHRGTPSGSGFRKKHFKSTDLSH